MITEQTAELIKRGAITKLVQHNTLKECIAQFVPQEAMLSPDEWAIGADDSGDGNEYTITEFINTINTMQPCWGICKSDKNEIHVFIGETATLSDVICLFAHEFGHLEPIFSDPELLSESYGRVAVRAWCAIRETLGDTWIRNQNQL